MGHGGCVTSLADLLPALAQATPQQLDAAKRALTNNVPAIDAGGFPHAIEPLLTLRGVATKLEISAPTLWRWKVPGHQLGGRPRYRLSEVVAYLESEEFKRHAAALRAERKRLRKTPNRPTAGEGGAK